jgi:hypothetical protein
MGRRDGDGRPVSAMLHIRTTDNRFSHLKVGGTYDDLIYVTSEETPAEAEATMRRFGLAVDERKKERSLAVKSYDEVYIVKGKVDPPAIIKGFSGITYEDYQRGYGMRAAAVMTCYFDQKQVPELVKYENDLHRKFSFPAMGLCGYSPMKMYNTKSLDVLWPIINAHALVIMTGPNGCFALKPDEFDRKDVEVTVAVPKGTIPENQTSLLPD